MYSRILGKDLEEDSVSSAYILFGEESYLADQFLSELRAALIPADSQDFHFDRFYLDETKWVDILDTAKTMPIFFSPWRVIVIKAPERKLESEKKSVGKEAKLISAAEGKLLTAYFSSPSPRTAIVIILPGKVNKSHALVRFFSTFQGVDVKELKPLKEREILKWIDDKARSLQKNLTPEAGKRLFEIVGSDLRLMDNEIEKLTVYVNERKVIGADDVDQVTAWIRSYDSYELNNGLEEANFKECLIVLDNLFKAGEKPEQILYRVFSFFRNILMAKTELQEKGRDKREIFKEFFPQISEKWGLYQKKFAAFFSLVEEISRGELAGLLDDLETADVRIKSSDVPPQAVFEAFLFRYCGLRKKTLLL